MNALTTISMTRAALASRADGAADCFPQDDTGECQARAYFRYDGMTWTDDGGFPDADFAAEVIGIVVELDGDCREVNFIYSREEARTAFGDAWVADVEGREIERVTM
jgi:hypothetical protein